MTWENMKHNKDIPDKGWILAYTREEVLFERYEKDHLENILKNKDILEIHLFDQEKEYRAIQSTSWKNRKNEDKAIRSTSWNNRAEGYIEHIASIDLSDQEHVYREEITLEKGGTIFVLNHVNYDETGMAFIDDYRLMMPEVEAAHE